MLIASGAGERHICADGGDGGRGDHGPIALLVGGVDIEIEIVPPEMALRLMTCREQVADKWVGALGNISTASSEAALSL